MRGVTISRKGSVVTAEFIGNHKISLFDITLNGKKVIKPDYRYTNNTLTISYVYGDIINILIMKTYYTDGKTHFSKTILPLDITV